MISKERKQSVAEMYALAEKFNTVLTAVLDYAELALDTEDYAEMERIAKQAQADYVFCKVNYINTVLNDKKLAKVVMDAYYKQQKAEIAKGVN